jgi:hypothetical protein
MKIQVAKNKIALKKKPTRCLGIQFNQKLMFQHNHEIVITNTRMAQHRVRTITGRQGLNPTNARKVQVAIVQSVALYGVELL